ncbi:hypothetical protein [Nocardia sp. CA-120079]|uniref:hypothetical protein n=1 Tax=Nocardia sp. CA-120079 TaxID=3239974 RepID=UPI003D9974D0
MTTTLTSDMNNPTEAQEPMMQQKRKTNEPNRDSRGLMPGPWFECRTCQGAEGEFINGQWVDCRACQGQGGWPEDVYADTTAVLTGTQTMSGTYTTTTTSTVPRRAGVLAAIGGAAVLLAGCAHDSTGSGSPWTPGPRRPAVAATALPPEQAGGDRNDPAAVAAAAMRIWFTWDTTRDAGPDDAAGRAGPLLVPAYAAALTLAAPIAGPGADWMRWSGQRARLVASVRAGAEPVPAASVSTAYAQLVIDQAVTAPDGTVGEHVSAVVDVRLARGVSGWEVASVQQR